MNVRKICLLGDFGVGKTSTVRRFVSNAYDDKYLTTVGVKIDTKEVQTPDGALEKLIIWDIAGSNSAPPAFNSYLRGTAGYLLVVDGTRPDTLDAALGLREQLAGKLGDIPWIGLLNKADLVDEWAIDESRITALREAGQVWLPTSALSGDNVEQAFSELAARMNA